MSQPTSPQAPAARRIAVRKPANDVFTALLGLSVAALLVGILLLVIEFASYGFTVRPTP
jgi:hypothetical protein